MERIKVTNRKKNPKNFFAANGVEITLEEGDNFIAAEDLQYLQQHSDGFRHFVKTNVLVIRDEKREETDEEAEERKNLLQKATAMFKNSMPGKANNAAVLDISGQSPGLDLSAFLQEFDKDIADASAKKLEEFNAKSEQLGEQISATIKGQVQADVESEILPNLKQYFVDDLEKFRKKQVDDFKAELAGITQNLLDRFKKDCAAFISEMTPDPEAKLAQPAKKSGKGSKH
jgi:hypothetical protein